MKKLPGTSVIGRALLAAAVATTGLQVAQAANGNYISIYGGLNDLDDTSIDSSDAGRISSDFDEGYGVGAAIGRWFDAQRHWRAEVEFAYRENDFDRIGRRGGGDAELSSQAYMVNGYYDFRPNASFSPYVGAGVGIADVEVEDVPFSGGRLDDEDSVFAYQFIGGVGYGLTERVDLFGELRYLATDEPRFNGGQELDYETVNALAGIRYSF